MSLFHVSDLDSGFDRHEVRIRASSKGMRQRIGSSFRLSFGDKME